MRAVLLSLLVLVFAACDLRSRDERNLERAERELAEAREQLDEAREDLDADLDEARERVREARKHLREARGDWNDELRDNLDEAGEDIRRAREDLKDAFDDEDIAHDLGEALESIGRALKTDSDVQPVDFRKLRDLLPDDIDGMELEDIEGQTGGAFGIRVSHVEAHYDGLGREVDVSIVDLGTLHGAATEALDWLDARIDRESDDGYERTTEIDGHPAHVRLERWGSRANLEATVFIAERFVVHVAAEGRDVSMEMVEEVVDGMGGLGISSRPR